MSRKLGIILGFAVVLASLAGRVGGAAPPDETPKAKLEALEKQRADLQKQEDAIAARLREIQQQVQEVQKQQRELRQKLDALSKQEQTLRQETEKAREKEYVIRVEIKGRLQRGNVAVPTTTTPAPEPWSITVKGLTCDLDFGGNKEFLELARKLEGKSVVATGTLSGRPSVGWYGYPYPGTYPYPWQNYYPYSTNPYPTSTLSKPQLQVFQQPLGGILASANWGPWQYPNPYLPASPVPVLAVATIKAAE